MRLGRRPLVQDHFVRNPPGEAWKRLNCVAEFIVLHSAFPAFTRFAKPVEKKVSD